MAVRRSQLASKARNCPGVRPLSKPANRQPATAGTASASGAGICPVRCSHRNSDRNAQTINFAVPTARPGQAATTNAVTSAPVNPAKTAAISRGIRTDTQRFYVERTHIDVIQAQALMALIGATSANFVSSPYHMRRIKIMAGKVFDADKYRIAFVPTAYEPRYVPWFVSGADVKWVFSEWGKIVWYFLYSPFV